MKKILLLLFLSSTFMLTGCMVSNTIEEQIPTSGSIVVGKTEYEMMTGKYEYYGKEMKIGTIEERSPYEIAEEFETLSVEKNEKIEILIEDNPSLIVNEWSEDGVANEISIKGNKITVPSKSGVFIYEVVANWPNGETYFIFDVEVE